MLNTNELVVASKSKIIFGSLCGLFLLISSAFIYVGNETHQMQQKVIDPLKHIVEEMSKASQEKEKDSSLDYKYQNNVIIENNVATPSATVTPVVYQYQYQYNYTYPTQPPAPTIEPGKPGSKEWQEEFDRTFNEMKTQNEQKTKEVQDAQKKFCEDNPNLCN